MKRIEDEMIVTVSCKFCGGTKEIVVDMMDYWDWEDGMPIIEAMPYLSLYDREMLISGMCETCCRQLYGKPH